MTKPTKNILFTYMYRDAANYKLSAQAIFKNPNNIELTEIEKVIKTNLDDGEFFVPHDWGLKKPTFDDYDPELDHDWCEYCGVEYTHKEKNMKISIKDFIEKINLTQSKHVISWNI